MYSRVIQRRKREQHQDQQVGVRDVPQDLKPKYRSPRLDDLYADDSV